MRDSYFANAYKARLKPFVSYLKLLLGVWLQCNLQRGSYLSLLGLCREVAVWSSLNYGAISNSPQFRRFQRG